MTAVQVCREPLAFAIIAMRAEIKTFLRQEAVRRAVRQIHYFASDLKKIGKVLTISFTFLQ